MDKEIPNMFFVERPHFVERAESMLENISDPVLLILRGHLLIEEALYECLSSIFHDLKFLEKANLRFLQKLHLVRSFHKEQPDREEMKNTFYQFAESLNTLRNRYAHNLEPKSIADLFPRLCIRQECWKKDEWNKESINDLMISIAYCIGYFWARAEIYNGAPENT